MPIRALLLPAALLLLAAAAAVSAGSLAAAGPNPPNSAAAQLASAAANQLSWSLRICGRCLMRLADAITGSSAVRFAPLRRAATAAQRGSSVLLALAGGGGLGTWWKIHGVGVLLAEWTGFWVGGWH